LGKGINRRNLKLKLPVHEPAGDWLVIYDLGTIMTMRAAYCSSYGCYYDSDCVHQSYGVCTFCHYYRVDNECGLQMINAIRICGPKGCLKAVETLKEDGEMDVSYYQRMDKLH
jgi:hypothetical protein